MELGSPVRSRPRSGQRREAWMCSARRLLPALSWCRGSAVPNRPRKPSYLSPALPQLHWPVGWRVVLFQQRWRIQGCVCCLTVSGCWHWWGRCLSRPLSSGQAKPAPLAPAVRPAHHNSIGFHWRCSPRPNIAPGLGPPHSREGGLEPRCRSPPAQSRRWASSSPQAPILEVLGSEQGRVCHILPPSGQRLLWSGLVAASISFMSLLFIPSTMGWQRGAAQQQHAVFTPTGWAHASPLTPRCCHTAPAKSLGKVLRAGDIRHIRTQGSSLMALLSWPLPRSSAVLGEQSRCTTPAFVPAR